MKIKQLIFKHDNSSEIFIYVYNINQFYYFY